MADDKIINLAARSNNNQLSDPISLLKDALAEIETGERKCNKLLILTLDDETGYDVGFYAAKMKCSELIALTSRANRIFNNLMD